MSIETALWVIGVYGVIAATVAGMVREWWRHSRPNRDTNPLNWRDEVSDQ